MILLSVFVVVLRAVVNGQAQAAASAAAPVAVTEVMAMTSVKPGAVVPNEMKPEEVREVAQLYMDGKIEQWYTRGDGKGQIFFLRVRTVDEAKAIFGVLPAVKAGYVVVEYVPVGPYWPVRLLTRQGAVGGTAQH